MRRFSAVAWLAVSHAEPAFVYEEPANARTGRSNYASVALPSWTEPYPGNGTLAAFPMPLPLRWQKLGTLPNGPSRAGRYVIFASL